MGTLRDVSIQPLDVILFRGVDPVSKAICFMEARKLGRGDFSHAGLAVTRDALDLPFLELGKERRASAKVPTTLHMTWHMLDFFLGAWQRPCPRRRLGGG